MGWQKLTTIHNKKDFANSLIMMNEKQIDCNLIQINLVALYNEEVMSYLLKRMQEPTFYLKNRYLLQNLINGTMTGEIEKKTIEAFNKFDSLYVNSIGYIQPHTQIQQHQENIEKIHLHGLIKQERAQFLTRQNKFICNLCSIGEQLMKLDNQLDKQAIFQQRIDQINKSISHENPNELDAQVEVQKGFCLCFNNKIETVTEILMEGSRYIETKNRNPLLLNLGFGRFIYKNDDQLSHELVAMSIIKYLNQIISSSYQSIVEYQIIPIQKGAFYQFVEQSTTLAKIKQNYTDGLVGYFNKFPSKKKNQMMKKFAQTYAGFCTVQYLLQLKDRNNANILIKQDGSILHIDLAFIFQATPGGISFETSPFKMPKQYIEVMDGFNSDTFEYFESLLVQNFTKLVLCLQQFTNKMKIITTRQMQIKCFKGFKLKRYLKKLPELGKVKEFIQDLIDQSYDNWKTNKYDTFQFKMNSIPC